MKSSHITLFVVLGIVFWYAAAILIKAFGENVFTENNPLLIVTYLLTFPLTLGIFFIAKAIARLKSHEMLKPFVVMTITATFCDGIVLAWFRSFYHPSFEVALHMAAGILWGAGVGLFIAFYLDIKKNKTAL